MSSEEKATTAQMPSGTVTFLFSDIEGSTRLLQRLGEKYAQVLADQQRLVRCSFQKFHGYEVDTAGDGFFVAFGRAWDGIAAAIEAQRMLAAHCWPEDETVRVRMALHTGEPVSTATGYVGLDVHRAARLCSTGYGGQILISETTRQLVINDLPEGVILLNLGEHRLKDLQHPEHIHQVVVSDLPRDFPPLKTLSNRPNNLPVHPTALVGREQELDTLRRLLLQDDVRLVTLSGPGGTGKTRLSLQVAAGLLEEFAEGTFFVALAAITDPNLVLSTIAQTLGVIEDPTRPLQSSIIEYLRSKSLLLLLDNFEQVTPAAIVVSELLASCPALKILVTSRIVLRLRGEHEYPVPPLPAPAPDAVTSLESLTQFAAVKLFIQRALAVQPNFAINNENAPAIAEICFRLDGLPLAIELAAARIKLLPPATMLKRLGSRLDFLKGGARDLPARHQTLRQAIAWSYDLLNIEEQKLFLRLAVFVGGCSLEAAEAICNAKGDLALDILDGLAALADKSLIRQEPASPVLDEPRMMMLETLREFALERLQASEDWNATKRAHADFFVELVEKAESELTGPEQAFWLDTLAREHDNLRAVFHWVEQAGEVGHGLRLGGALWRFWLVRGHIREGYDWLQALLALPHADKRTRERAKALNGAGTILHNLSDFRGAHPLFKESLEIWREIGDQKGIATVLDNLAWIACNLGDLDFAEALTQEALVLHPLAGNKRGEAVALNNLSWVAYHCSEFPLARLHQEKSLNIRREIGDEVGVGYAMGILGMIEEAQGNYEKAIALMEEGGSLSNRLGYKLGTAWTLIHLGNAARKQGELARAATLFKEGLTEFKKLGNKWGIATALYSLGVVAHEQGNHKLAQELLEESLPMSRERGIKWETANVLCYLGHEALERNDFVQANSCYVESLTLHQHLRNKLGIAGVLAGFGRMALVRGNHARAARLRAVIETIHAAIGAPMSACARAKFEDEGSALRHRLGEEAFAAAWTEGESMTMDQALAYAISSAPEEKS